MHPVLLVVGGVPVFTYGAVLVVAAATAVAWAMGFAGRRCAGLDEWTILEMAVITLGAGLAAAVLAGLVLEGGGARSAGILQAGAVAGVSAGLLDLRRRRLPVLATADLLVGALPLGAAIGRLGCLAAGCCFGRPTGLPWGITYTEPTAHALAGVPLGIALHPTPVYLGLASLGVFAAVRALAAAGPRPGTALCAWLLLDGTTRVLLEPFRADTRAYVGPLPLAQALGIAAAVAGLAGLAGLGHLRRRA